MENSNMVLRISAFSWKSTKLWMNRDFFKMKVSVYAQEDEVSDCSNLNTFFPVSPLTWVHLILFSHPLAMYLRFSTSKTFFILSKKFVFSIFNWLNSEKGSWFYLTASQTKEFKTCSYKHLVGHGMDMDLVSRK